MRRSEQRVRGTQAILFSMGLVPGIGGRPERRRGPRTGQGPGGRLVRAASLAGEHVVTRSGEPIGSVSELMLDVRRGRIAYAVVAQGGFMGIAERLQPIPWRALALDEARHCLVLGADRAVFLAAPGFDKDHWPLDPEPGWHHALHRHYGCRPYWEPQ